MSATELARALLTRLLAGGVREYVLAPGSRNAPLAFALADAADAGLLRLHTRIDERTAGFLALGLTKVGRRAAVVCTSGTAVANLHPAALESAHSGVPTVFLTADRPASLRGTGASQTTDQTGVFGELVQFHDVGEPGDVSAAGAAVVAGAVQLRPVHLNVQFSGLLVPEDRWQPAPVPVVAVEPPPAPTPYELPSGPRTVVVAGDDAGSWSRVLAERAGWPLLAEPTSAARRGDHAVRTYRLLLETELGAAVERVVLAGHPTLSRPVSALLERADVEVVSVPPRGCWPTRPFPVAREEAALAAPADGPSAADEEWLAVWRSADRTLGRQIDRLLASEPDLTPHEVARTVGAAVPEGGLLWVGASNPIRDLDLMMAPTSVGARRKVVANRGLAGIDGTLSSAVGAALGRPGPQAYALVGDVTFVHDLTGLVTGTDQERPDLTVVVVNDDGGSIFTTLEQGAPQYADRYDRLFGTPHGVDLASACAAVRIPHLRVHSLPELEQALASPNGGLEVVEVVVRRDNRRDLDARLRALASDLG
ncbi:MAG: 2-succinyl-5-enolpyruvyl-6-hydroxy-3-cyclohexene-1-carboxylic-acid synthase [Nocardioides sp.]|uniref:2-succinyl-5-enolpyruvyl-6-hydroxy-3- cyclohexene-1-carboxylic-acid synthase n=1 Tax=Nocardioides sp. TaxID=35761 RepID=UPI003F127112